MARQTLLLVSALASLIAIFGVLSDPTPSDPWQVYVAILGLAWLVTYFMTTAAYFGTVYLFSTAFLLPLTAFHLSWIVIDALGLENVIGFNRGELARYFVQAGWYVVLAYGCFGLGLAASMYRRRHQLPPRTVGAASHNPTLSWTFWMGLGLLAASAVFFALFILAVGNPFLYSRADFFETAVAGRGLGAFLMVFPGAVVAMVIGAQTGAQRTAAWSLAGLAAFVLLFSGYRSQALFPILIAGVLLAKTGRRLPKWLPLMALIAIIIVVPVVSKVRELTYGRISADVVEASYEASSPIEAFLEVGGTLGVLATALKVVPRTAEYQYGWSYFVALRDSIPNVTGTMQESLRAEAMRGRLSGGRDIFDLPPGDWMTFVVDPVKFRLGHGTGFSMIAEPYINFGVTGVIVFFLALGYLMGKLERLPLLAHPWVLFLCCSTGWAFLRIVRNSSGNFVKPLVFIICVALIWRIISPILPFRFNPYSGPNHK